MTRESKISASWKNGRFHLISHGNSYTQKQGFSNLRKKFKEQDR